MTSRIDTCDPFSHFKPDLRFPQHSPSRGYYIPSPFLLPPPALPSTTPTIMSAHIPSHSAFGGVSFPSAILQPSRSSSPLPRAISPDPYIQQAVREEQHRVEHNMSLEPLPQPHEDFSSVAEKLIQHGASVSEQLIKHNASVVEKLTEQNNKMMTMMSTRDDRISDQFFLLNKEHAEKIEKLQKELQEARLAQAVAEARLHADARITEGTRIPDPRKRKAEEEAEPTPAKKAKVNEDEAKKAEAEKKAETEKKAKEEKEAAEKKAKEEKEKAEKKAEKQKKAAEAARLLAEAASSDDEEEKKSAEEEARIKKAEQKKAEAEKKEKEKAKAAEEKTSEPAKRVEYKCSAEMTIYFLKEAEKFKGITNVKVATQLKDSLFKDFTSKFITGKPDEAHLAEGWVKTKFLRHLNDRIRKNSEATKPVEKKPELTPAEQVRQINKAKAAAHTPQTDEDADEEMAPVDEEGEDSDNSLCLSDLDE